MKRISVFNSHTKEVYYSTLLDGEKGCEFLCNTSNEIIFESGKKYRRGRYDNGEYCTYVISDDKELLERPRYFKEVLYAHSLLHNYVKVVEDEIKEDENKRVKRLIHNLRSLNAKNLQELFNLLPSSDLAEAEHKKDYILRKVNENIRGVSEAMFEIFKNTRAIKNEFTVFDKLFIPNPPVSIKSHPIHRVILNNLHFFYDDFTSSGIFIDLQEISQQVKIDYDSFSVALYHILENASKYSLPRSTIGITFDSSSDYFIIVFSMISMQICDFEKDRIFEEGYSGENPRKKKKNGSGVGLHIVSQTLKLNNARIEIERNPNNDGEIEDGGALYVPNIFKIFIKK